MNYSEKYNDYIERLLLLQYEASQIFKHKPTVGEIREEFIKNILKSQYEGIVLYKGSVICDEFQSKQLDLIAVSKNENHRIIKLGNNNILINLSDAKIIVEVKVNAKHQNLEH